MNDDDGDTCDECSSGTYDSANDGWDYDLDGACDAGDDDDDNDGISDEQDLAELDEFVCVDNDGDTCDDCSSGTYNSSNDGWDFDGDGLCDDGDPDDDNDGVIDGEDSEDNDAYLCSDNDGDACDDCSSGSYSIIDDDNGPGDGDDDDNDGKCNVGDRDMDGDGFAQLSIITKFANPEDIKEVAFYDPDPEDGDARKKRALVSPFCLDADGELTEEYTPESELLDCFMGFESIGQHRWVNVHDQFHPYGIAMGGPDGDQDGLPDDLSGGVIDDGEMAIMPTRKVTCDDVSGVCTVYSKYADLVNGNGAIGVDGVMQSNYANITLPTSTNDSILSISDLSLMIILLMNSDVIPKRFQIAGDLDNGMFAGDEFIPRVEVTDLILVAYKLVGITSMPIPLQELPCNDYDVPACADDGFFLVSQQDCVDVLKIGDGQCHPELMCEFYNWDGGDC